MVGPVWESRRCLICNHVMIVGLILRPRRVEVSGRGVCFLAEGNGIVCWNDAGSGVASMVCWCTEFRI